jgi:2-dehydropantoate 2-reductase
VVIPFQNGVDSIERIGVVLGAPHVAGGVARIFAIIEAPGVIRHTGSIASLTYGATDPAQRTMLAAFDEACASAGFEHKLVDDIELALWQKFVFLAAFSAATAVTRRPIGVIRADPDTRAMLEAALREGWQVGRARGIALADDFVNKLLAMIDTLAPDMRASMANDLAAGNRLEAPWLSGHLVRMARVAGVAAPVQATLYAALKPFCSGRENTR